jgi:hypothetical protein
MAWLPWYWLALRAIGRRRWAWLGAAAALHLIIVAGWPFTVLMAALVGGLVFATALAERRSRDAAVIAASSLAGLAIAAPAALILVEYFRSGSRMSIATQIENLWVVPPSARPGLVIPTLQTKWVEFSANLPHAAVELAGAFVPLTGIVAALVAVRNQFWRENRALLLLAGSLLCLLLLPSGGPFRWSFRWLPLFHLVLALCGARGLALVAARGRLAAICAAALLTGTTSLAAVLDYDFTSTITFATVMLIGCGLWFVATARIRAAMPAALTLATIALLFVAFLPADEVPRWNIDESLLRPAPFDPSRLYLGLYDFHDVIDSDADGRLRIGRNPELRPGNLPMLAGVTFVNGYSPIRPAGIAKIFAMDTHGPLPRPLIPGVIARDTGPGALLHHLGVDGLVMTADDFAQSHATLARNGWQPVARTGNAIVVHRHQRVRSAAREMDQVVKVRSGDELFALLSGRNGPFPMLIVEPGVSPHVQRYQPRGIRNAIEGRLSSEVVVNPGPSEALIVFGRAWLPGWRATIDGRALQVRIADGVMPAVEIPAGVAGRLVIDYRPASLVTAVVLSAMAFVVVAAVSIRLLFSKT